MTAIGFSLPSQKALSALRIIDRDLAATERMIATGKEVAEPADNPYRYTTAMRLRGDATTAQTIADSLSLSASTLAVGASAAEQVQSLLGEIETLIASAEASGANRTAIQTDIDNIVDQISSVVTSARFNSVNLLSGSDPYRVFAGLTATDNGSPAVQTLTFARADLTQSAGTTGTGKTSGEAGAVHAGSGLFSDSATTSVADSSSGSVTFASGAVEAGDIYTLTLGGETARYRAVAGDTADSVAATLGNRLSGLVGTGITVAVASNVVTVTNASGGSLTLSATANAGAAGGGLEDLAQLNVGSSDAALSALADIEGLIDLADRAVASLGSAQSRIGAQQTLLEDIAGQYEAGAAALTDADLAEAAAKLQLLQARQALALEALEIANSAPSRLLSLFD
ncbi:flagellin protein [Parvularcula bermudensis HTCC2503]|uniref:Flagellin n=1 Tax=Parvularcula bermudensis (strain ATCC BAA-594 / HTCC2503 / KCTC 12087) TaxID=314260 RepID=E0TBM4_PARBH|nr:flagellin [Parvularcula bermudensis]ADM08399.1 flagellin protein [Parvularcula bermudensis HTCC2503]